MANFMDLLEQHAAASLDKQWILNELFGQASWQLDVEAGTLTFDEKHVFPCQIIGTESDLDQTWLWAWANTASDLPPHVLVCAERLKALGLRDGIPELTQRKIDRGQVDGHTFALVGTGVCDADCYYRGPYEGGAVYLLLDAPMIRARADTSALRISSVFTHLIASYPVNHRRAFAAYMTYKGCSASATSQGFEVQMARGERMQATFDEHDRLIELNVDA